MSVEKVREYLTPYGVADRMREFEVSSATVELAAQEGVVLLTGGAGCSGCRCGGCPYRQDPQL